MKNLIEKQTELTRPTELTPENIYLKNKMIIESEIEKRIDYNIKLTKEYKMAILSDFMYGIDILDEDMPVATDSSPLNIEEVKIKFNISNTLIDRLDISVKSAYDAYCCLIKRRDLYINDVLNKKLKLY